VARSLDSARHGLAFEEAARDVARWLYRPKREQDGELERERAYARRPMRARARALQSTISTNL